VEQQKGQVVGYLRVSSAEQNVARQIEAVGQVDRSYTDRISGKDTDRPALAEALRYLRDGDTLRVASMDRLARNVDDLRRIVRDLTERGVRVEFVKEALTFTGDDSAMSNLLLSILGSVAEFERALIRERQAEGIAAAKARGEYAGRGGRPRALSPEQVAEARQRLAEGLSKAEVARSLGVGRSSLYRALDGSGAYAREGIPVRRSLRWSQVQRVLGEVEQVSDRNAEGVC